MTGTSDLDVIGFVGVELVHTMIAAICPVYNC